MCHYSDVCETLCACTLPGLVVCKLWYRVAARRVELVGSGCCRVIVISLSVFECTVFRDDGPTQIAAEYAREDKTPYNQACKAGEMYVAMEKCPE